MDNLFESWWFKGPALGICLTAAFYALYGLYKFIEVVDRINKEEKKAGLK